MKISSSGGNVVKRSTWRASFLAVALLLAGSGAVRAAGVKVAGHVYGAGGQPARAIAVWLGRLNFWYVGGATTDDTGYFEIHDVQQGTYQLNVFPTPASGDPYAVNTSYPGIVGWDYAGYSAYAFQVGTTDVTDLLVNLVRGGIVVGTARSTSGAALPGVPILFSDDFYLQGLHRQSYVGWRTGQTGAYRIDGQTPLLGLGDAEATAMAPNANTVIGAVIGSTVYYSLGDGTSAVTTDRTKARGRDLAVGSTTTVDLTLPDPGQTGTIVVTVQAADTNAPLSGADVALCDTNGVAQSRLVANAQGSAIFPGVYAGDYEVLVNANASGYPQRIFNGQELNARAAPALTLAAGGTLPVTIAVPKAAGLTASPGTFTFTAPSGGPSFASGPIALTRNAGPASGFIASSDQSWLVPSAASGTFDASGSASFSFSVAPAALPAGSYEGRLTLAGNDSPVPTFTIVVSLAVSSSGACPVPGAPVLVQPDPSAFPRAGQPVVLTWTAPPDAGAGASYVLELARDLSFATPSTISTSWLSALVPTDLSATDYVLYARVRAVQACGAAGPGSQAVGILVSGVPAEFLLARAGPALTASVGEAPPSGPVSFTNVGAVSGRLTLTATGGFFDVAPTSLDVAPGATGSVTVTARPAALAQPGFFPGTLVGTYSGASGSERIATGVTLTVSPAGPPAGSGASVRASAGSVVFAAPAGQSPASQTVTFTLDPVPAQGAVYLVAAVNPGGSWLVLPNTLASPVPASGVVTVTLSVDRSRRTPSDGVPPLRTLLRVTPAGAPAENAAVVEVLDVEPTVVQTSGGTDRSAAPAAGSSFIVPTAARGSGAGGAVFFASDGWLRNEGAASVSADLYFSPDSEDGLAGPGVRKTTLTLPGGSTRRLSDLLSSVFQTSGSGQVEVRASSAADLASLSLRTVVEAVTGGDARTRYGTEIPTVSFGAGVAAGEGELVIPGIDDGAENRANLILAETTGAPATAAVTVTDASGAVVGSRTFGPVPPFGKIQVNGLVGQVAPGATLTGGWAGVKVASGAGKVVALATVIDNASNSFSAVKGRTAQESSPRGESPEAPAPVVLVVPSVARLTGAFDTHFETSLSIVNGTSAPANLALTYRYVDVDDGNTVKSAQAAVTIPPRGALPRLVGGDVVPGLFRVANRSYGWIRVEGDVSRVVSVASISALVDPNDKQQGRKTAQVDGIPSDSLDLMAAGQPERRFAGAEKSFQRRTNLILVETTGQPAEAVVRAYRANGDKLAERTFPVAASQYFQINDVFGDTGLRMGAGPFQNVVLSVQAVSGAGRLVALATVNDNVSRNPEIFLLKAPGIAPPSPRF